MMTRKAPAALVGLVLLLSFACSSGGNHLSVEGRVNLLLTDAPIDLSQVKEVRVTLEEILLFEFDSGDDDADGMKMEGPIGEGLTLNLLDYQNGETILIASLDAPAGDYRKVRMKIADAELVTEDPNDPKLEIVEPIFVPSGKVDVPVPFTVTGGDTADVTLDFDAALSVQVNLTGNHRYILRPVIVPVGVQMH